MTIQKENSHITITPKNKTYSKDVFTNLNTSIKKYKESNIILDFSNFSINDEELIEFKNISKEKTENGTSFVVIKKDVNLDIIPDELIVVPTFQEAIDMIEMDEMTRSLDF